MVIVKPAPSLRTPSSSLSLRSSRRLHPYRRPLAEEEDENVPVQYRPRYYDDDLLYLVLAAERRRVLQEVRNAEEDREENAEDGAMAMRALIALTSHLGGMRESNFAFPAQNKACVCITSQLYDRRALDTTSPLPLFNSLTHLAYLTSTSPRIREIMTMDGGLERLVRLLLDFCISPPPPENPSLFYGLAPPGSRAPKLVPTLNPATWDKHASYRFSLAFQCVVNIGVRGTEPIRSRVVQAGTLEVVGCILEAWLAHRQLGAGGHGGITGSGSGSGARETREQRHARRLARQMQQRHHNEQQRNEQDDELARALQRQMSHTETPATTTNHTGDTSISQDDQEHDNETASATSSTTASPVTSTRDRSGTLIAPPRRNNAHTRNETATYHNSTSHVRNNPHPSPSPSPAPSTDDDNDVDMSSSTSANASDADRSDASNNASPERRSVHAHPHVPVRRRGSRLTVTAAPTMNQITMNNPNGMGMEDNAHIVLTDDMPTGMIPGLDINIGEVGVGVVMDANDDLAMGAPPGAPGAMGLGVGDTGMGDVSLEESMSETEREERDTTPNTSVNNNTNTRRPILPPALGMGERSRSEEAVPSASSSTVLPTSQEDDGMLSVGTGTIRGRRDMPPDVTPRAAVVGLPPAPSTANSSSPSGDTTGPISRSGTLRGRPGPAQSLDDLLDLGTQPPPVRSRGDTIVPAQQPPITIAQIANNSPPLMNVNASPNQNQNMGRGIVRPSAPAPPGSQRTYPQPTPSPYRDEDVLLGLQLLAYLSKYPHVRQAFYKKRDGFHPVTAGLPVQPGPSRKKGKEKDRDGTSASGSASGSTSSASADSPNVEAQTQTQPKKQTNVFSLVEKFTFRPSSSHSDEGRVPQEIQYWAGVIMRNACRKDDSRGGIRQCANMLCGRWESYPREFAKCRRCRKAKYCGKECQSTAWSEGHRFWCSAKEVGVDEELPAPPPPSSSTALSVAERRAEQMRETVRRERAERGGRREEVEVLAALMMGNTQGQNVNMNVRLPPQFPLPSPPGNARRRGDREILADPAMYAEYLRTVLGGRPMPPEGAEGRRRAETVTGVHGTMVAGGRAMVIPPYIPGPGQVNHRVRGGDIPPPVPERNPARRGQSGEAGDESMDVS
ncbi:hypothetical protein VNI00_011778 [Paramarasmius palmivorus]|uniref:MYND-type domain-containing protein n=1 Tax=Paramarasmius palmivorus TaxID=297713 RepID=A0AAW0C9Q4_9AGAR